jgi:hypothetical protein
VEGTVTNHVTPLPESAVFKMAYGQQKTVDLELVKKWQVSTFATGFSWCQAIASDGTFFYTKRPDSTFVKIDMSAQMTVMVNGFSGGSGIDVDGGGNVYFTGSNAIRKISINDQGLDYSSVPVLTSGLPGGGYCITMADDGYLYVTTDSYIMKVHTVTGQTETVVGGFSAASGIGAYDNFLYVTDNNRHTLWKVDPVTRQKVLLAGADGFSVNQDGIGGDARFSAPKIVVPDGAGNLYIIQEGSDIRKVNIATRKVTTLSITGGSVSGYRWGACMVNGDLYVLSGGDGIIKKLTRNY